MPKPSTTERPKAADPALKTVQGVAGLILTDYQHPHPYERALPVGHTLDGANIYKLRIEDPDTNYHFFEVIMRNGVQAPTARDAVSVMVDATEMVRVGGQQERRQVFTVEADPGQLTVNGTALKSGEPTGWTYSWNSNDIIPPTATIANDIARRVETVTQRTLANELAGWQPAPSYADAA